jgi:hypothetical protein
MSPNGSVEIEIFFLNVFTLVCEQRGMLSVLHNLITLYK